MVVTIDCKDTINCKVTMIVLCNRAQISLIETIDIQREKESNKRSPG